MAPASPPIPLNATVAGVDTEVELMVNAPFNAPACMGAKTTPVVQLVPAASVVPQVFWTSENCAVSASSNPAASVPPLLVTVTVCAALVWPVAVAGNPICAGVAFKPAADWPVPFKFTVAAFTCSVEEVMVSVACADPVAAGVKVTCIVQLAPAARSLPQVVVPVAKLLAPGPVIWKPTFAMGAPPELVTLRVCGALAMPTCRPVNARLAGLTAKAGGLSPVPCRLTVCVRKMSATVSVPAWLPEAVGRNTTLIEQLAGPVSCVVQLFDC